MNSATAVSSPGLSASDRRALFWACFTAIAATAAVFAVRGQVIGAWAREFGLTETQKGEILGVGLWPFAAAIVGVSMVADRLGYGRCLFFAFACHIASTFILLFAKGYWGLYAGTFLVSIGNGAAQAIADPVVASMYRQNKTTWLNILHASWPAGMVAGGIAGIALGVGGGLDWRWRIGMLLGPMLLYGVLMLGHRFPVHERIEAGGSDREMFRETGAIGLFLMLVFLFGEFGRLLNQPRYAGVIAARVCAGAFGLATRSLGQPMFLFLLVLMIPLATTELGTDSWITSLMEIPMKAVVERRLGAALHLADHDDPALLRGAGGEGAHAARWVDRELRAGDRRPGGVEQSDGAGDPRRRRALWHRKNRPVAHHAGRGGDDGDLPRHDAGGIRRLVPRLPHARRLPGRCAQ